MNRKIILFPLAMAAILGLASCTSENPQPSNSEPETSQVPSSNEEVKTPTIAITEGDITLEVGAFKALTVKIENIENKNVTWASDNTEVAAVDAGVVTAVKEGEAKITATLDADNTIKAEIKVTVTPKTFTATKASIADLASGNDGIKEGTLYEVEGILEGLKSTDVMGNAFLTDPATGKSVKIYGMTGTESALTEADGTFTFKNPKDATTTLAGVNNGEKVTVWGVYTSWAKNISCVLKSHVADTTKYGVNIAAFENGTATADKTEYSYGETVKVTVTPKEGYVISTIGGTDAFGNVISITKTSDTTYTFAATCVNNIKITMKSASDTKNVVEVVFDTSSGFPGAVVKEDTEFTVAMGMLGNMKMGGQYIYCNSSYVMLNRKAGDSFFYNKEAVPGKIVSVEITTGSSASTAAQYDVTFGDAALSTYSSNDGVVVSKGEKYTFNAGENKNTGFFQVSVHGKANGQVAKMVITYDTAA